MGMFDSNSVEFPWNCPKGHDNIGSITRDEDPVESGDTTIVTCRKCDYKRQAKVLVILGPAEVLVAMSEKKVQNG